jgi:pyruvate dehydrogenase E1 component
MHWRASSNTPLERDGDGAARQQGHELGGHIASFASAATLYDVGFNHFWHAPSDRTRRRSDLLPGPFGARRLRPRLPAGRLSEEQLDNFRQEVDGKGLSSYPHPWLMPDFWQFPTVSMGLGPLMAIYQARFMKYLHDRGIAEDRRPQGVGFMGDGEMDEPESLGAIALAGARSSTT